MVTLKTKPLNITFRSSFFTNMKLITNTKKFERVQGCGRVKCFDIHSKVLSLIGQ